MRTSSAEGTTRSLALCTGEPFHRPEKSLGGEEAPAHVEPVAALGASRVKQFIANGGGRDISEAAVMPACEARA